MKIVRPHPLAATYVLVACTLPACDVALGIQTGVPGCDGTAVGEAIPDQVLGDCRARICDVNGVVGEYRSPNDPEDDGHECTVDECKDFETVHTTKPKGTLAADQTASDCKIRVCNGTDADPVSQEDTNDVNDDGNECTIDAFDGQSETHTKKPAGSPCGALGTCQCSGAGECVDCKVDSDCAPLSNTCQRAICKDNACTHQARADGDPCDDSNACTQTDTCQAGVCTGASPMVCGAGLSCADGACVWCNGKFGFPEAPLHALGYAREAVATGDFNGDGKPDLVFAHYSDHKICVVLSLGGGKYAAPVTYNAMYPTSVAVGDYNGDGKLDFAATQESLNKVSIWLNTGIGAFGSPVDYTAGMKPHRAAAADLNADMKLDLAVANYDSGDVSIFLGQSNGTFAISASDRNGDGKADIAVASRKSGDISVLLNQGTGTFAAAVKYPEVSDARGVVPADLNGDGKTDLAVANGTKYQRTLSNEGNGTFPAAAPHDILIDGIHVLKNNGNGTFAAPTSYSGGQDATIADFNGDGKADIVGLAGSGILSLPRNTGNGAFGTPTYFAAPNGGGWGTSFATADFNADGRPDIAALDDSGVSILLSTCVL